jgi:hypothetical protein
MEFASFKHGITTETSTRSVATSVTISVVNCGREPAARSSFTNTPQKTQFATIE